VSADSEPTAAAGAALAEGEIGPAIFRDWLEAIQVINDEARLRFCSDGVRVAVVHDDQTCTVETTLYAEAFESYFHAGGDTEHRRILDTTALDETARLADTDQEELVTLRADGESDPVRVDGGPVARNTATFDELGSAEVPDYELAPTYRAAVERTELQFAVKAARIAFLNRHTAGGGHGPVSVIGEPDGTLRFLAEGDTDEIEHTLEVVDVVEAPDAEETRALYGTDKLAPVVKTIPDGAVVALQFAGDQHPISIRWTLQEEVHGETTTIAEARYVIAPRVETSGGFF
jgi:hypothetical protein